MTTDRLKVDIPCYDKLSATGVKPIVANSKILLQIFWQDMGMPMA